MCDQAQPGRAPFRGGQATRGGVVEDDPRRQAQRAAPPGAQALGIEARQGRDIGFSMARCAAR